MIRIAVVGDVGSGKTYVARLFGLPVFNADREVVKIYRNSRLAYKKLNSILPKFIFSFPIKLTIRPLKTSPDPITANSGEEW